MNLVFEQRHREVYLDLRVRGRDERLLGILPTTKNDTLSDNFKSTDAYAYNNPALKSRLKGLLSKLPSPAVPKAGGDYAPKAVGLQASARPGA